MIKRCMSGVWTTIAILFCAQAAASEGSGFYLRFDAGASMHPSDRNLETLWYEAGPDYANLTDRQTRMVYHFDQKFGASLSGAAGYRVGRAWEAEIGFAYTGYAVNEINQFSRQTWLQEGLRRNATVEYFDAEGADFSAFTIRPAVRFKPPVRGAFSMYIAAGLGVQILSGSCGLVYEAPGTSIDGLPPELLRIEFDGSETLLGLDIASGLEIRVAPPLALHIGAAYAFMQNAFKDFHGIIVDEDLASEFEHIGYTFDGMDFSGLRVAAGVVWYP